MMHNFRMGSKPFHEWYQEWSTYASRSGANENTKMYAFCHSIPRALNNKLVGISPQPTTMADLICHAKVFDENFCMYNASCPQHPNVRANQTDNPDDPLVNFTTPPNNKFKKLTKEQKAYRRKNGLCMYCGTKGHFQNKCPKKFNPSHPNPGPRTRPTDTTDDTTPDFDPDTEAPEITKLYHEPTFQTYDFPKDHDCAQDF